MRSKIYTGQVYHHRLGKIVHKFEYPVYFYAFDLDELNDLENQILVFSHNKINVVSLFDKDYLHKSDLPLKQKVCEFLQNQKIKYKIDKVILITSARYFGYVFNPVSFFYCYDASQNLVAFIAEVNNTFGEKHFYIVKQSDWNQDSQKYRKAVAKKSFHVSPFYDLNSDYNFYFTEPKDYFETKIHVSKKENPLFLSYIKGNAFDLNSKNLHHTLIKYPISAFLTMPRILWEAAQLHYRKGLKVYTKPNPMSLLTMQVKEKTLQQKIAQSYIFRFFAKMQSGRLQVTLPDRTQKYFGEGSENQTKRLIIHNYDFFIKVLQDADIGFGESYVAGDWESDDVTGLIELFIQNLDEANDRNLLSAFLSRFTHRLYHLKRKNTLWKSQKNIQDHYDLGNDFFKIFLDPTMMYSSAYFSRKKKSLMSAQKAKIDLLIDKAQIQKKDHVLEIGCGWGSFAIEAAKKTGCKVTGVTLSKEQFHYCMDRVKKEGLESQVEFVLRDYRKLKGQFDKIVSIEMIEAVGHEYLPQFFKKCESLLKKNGIAVFQVITLPEQRYDAYRKGCDWIQKHIFPGANVPSLKAMQDAMAKSSRFYIHDVQSLGLDYAKTLHIWKKNFLKNKDQILKQGFDEEFFRKWVYYFSYCEAGFKTQALNNLQIILQRPV